MTAIQTNAATIKKVKAQLSAWGWPSDLIVGYETRQNHQAPLLWQGVTVHHTGSNATATSYMLNPRDRASLVILCNAHITRDHKIKFLAAGGASHAGNVYKPTFDTTIAGKAPLTSELKPGADGTFSANRPTFGIEVDGGGGNEWDAWMLGAVVATCAAFHVVNGWKEASPRVTTHKELTRRKPGDPAINAGKLRTLVKEFIAAPYGPNGPVVVTPPPVVVPPVVTPPVVVKSGVRFMQFNIQDERFGPKLAGRINGIVASIKAGNPHVVTLNEAPETARNKIRAALPGGSARWLVFTNRATAILWDSSVLEHCPIADVKCPTWGSYHGAVIAWFTIKATKVKITVAAYHLQPNSVASNATQIKQVAAVLAAARKMGNVRFIGGDGANSDSWFPEWNNARVVAVTSKTRNKDTYKKGSITDRIHIDSKNPKKVVVDSYEVGNTTGSDHNPVIVVMTIS